MPVLPKPITLKDGKVHQFYFPTRPLIRLEEITGASYLNLGAIFGVNVTAKEINSGKADNTRLLNQIRLTRLVEIAWAGLLHEKPGLTLDEVMDLIDPNPVVLADVLLALLEALAAAIVPDTVPTGEAKNGKGPDPSSKPEKSSQPTSID